MRIVSEIRKKMSNNFKSKLKNKQTLIGTIVTLPSPSIAEIYSQLDFDWLWIDMEHSSLSIETTQNIIQATDRKCACLVRSPDNDRIWIKRILDTGCDGIIIPQINTATAAKNAIAACKYPPEGIRSVGISRGQNYGLNLQETLEKSNQNITIILQIEHIEAVNNIDAILDLPGCDAILIGPFDLSASMNTIGQVDRPEVVEAINKVKKACLQKNIPCGIFAKDSQTAIKAKQEGFNLICVGVDIVLLWKTARSTLEKINSDR